MRGPQAGPITRLIPHVNAAKPGHVELAARRTLLFLVDAPSAISTARYVHARRAHKHAKLGDKRYRFAVRENRDSDAARPTHHGPVQCRHSQVTPPAQDAGIHRAFAARCRRILLGAEARGSEIPARARRIYRARRTISFQFGGPARPMRNAATAIAAAHKRLPK